MGVQLGPDMVEAEAGSLAFKPRGQWHTFWNAGEGPCRVLEIIAPGGFEEMFAEMGADPEMMAGERAAARSAERREGKGRGSGCPLSHSKDRAGDPGTDTASAARGVGVMETTRSVAP